MARNYEITMKAGDTGPPVRVHILNDSDRTTPDLTGATVTYKLLRIDAVSGEVVAVFDKAAVVESPAATSGTVRYDWAVGDTVVPAGDSSRFMSVFRILYNDGTVEHYPNEGYIWVTIEQDG